MNRGIFLLIGVLLQHVITMAQNRVFASFTPGFSYVLPAPLVVSANEQPSTAMWAHYRSEPFDVPIYYSYRLGYCNNSKGWELEMNHLKVYLDNTSSEVQHFAISHGYNQVFVNRYNNKGHYGTKWGVGVVVAHPENTINGQKLDETKGLFNNGYYISGPAVHYSLFKELALGKKLFLLGEAKISLGYANVPIANGRAHAPVMAFHLLLGPGINIFGSNN